MDGLEALFGTVKGLTGVDAASALLSKLVSKASPRHTRIQIVVAIKTLKGQASFMSRQRDPKSCKKEEGGGLAE